MMRRAMDCEPVDIGAVHRWLCRGASVTNQDMSVPLAVDLDGTLIRGDAFIETAMRLLRDRPLAALRAVARIHQGIGAMKAAVHDALAVDATQLPYDPDLLSALQAEKAKGRKLVLATAADQRVAQAVADHLGLFDQVLASTPERNLKGATKAQALIEAFGLKGFDYVGDSKADLAVWRAARSAWVVNARPTTRGKAAADADITVDRQIGEMPAVGLAWLKAMRPHQWAKNALVFLPLIAARELQPGLIAMTALAALAFSLLASAVYLINDIFDVADDRRHPRKSKRPIASGRLPIPRALLLALGLLGLTALVTAYLPLPFAGVLVVYFLLTTAYSVELKRHPIVDVFALAALYTIRIIAGAAATGIELSFWLFSLSMFLFLSLALIKRVSELLVSHVPPDQMLPGRGYSRRDLPMLRALGVGAGFAATLVLALYVNSDVVRQGGFTYPDALWGVCGLVCFWICRAWLITDRGEMHDDPVVFALRDRLSLLIGALTVALFLVAVG